MPQISSKSRLSVKTARGSRPAHARVSGLQATASSMFAVAAQPHRQAAASSRSPAPQEAGQPARQQALDPVHRAPVDRVHRFVLQARRERGRAAARRRS